MGYKIEWVKSAVKEFDKLDNSVKPLIQKFLDKLAEREDPRTLGDELSANLVGLWKYRVGDYRLIAEIQDEVFKILLVVIGHRRDIYDKASKYINRHTAS
jgi:mRNA interferase RelE/StbE